MSNHAGKFKKVTAVTLSSLILGGMLATAPTIVASPDSPFGAVESAHAVTGNVVSPASYTLTHLDHAKYMLNMDFTGVQVNPGDSFTLQTSIGTGDTPITDVNVATAELQKYLPDTFQLEHTKTDNTAIKDQVFSVLGGKEINYVTTSWGLSGGASGVTSIRDVALPDGTIIAKRQASLVDGAYVFVFTDAVAGRTDIKLGLPVETENRYIKKSAGDPVDMITLRASTGSDHISTFPDIFKPAITVDEWKALPNGSPIEFDFGTVPTSLYLSGQKIITTNSPVESSYVKRERTIAPMLTRVVGSLSDSGESIRDGLGFVSPVRATKEDVGVRQTITTQFNDSVLQNFDLTKLENLRQWGYWISYSTPKPDGTGFWQPTPEELQGIYGTSDHQIYSSMGGPYDVRIESINTETGTVVWSWVPKHEGETIQLDSNKLPAGSPYSSYMSAKPEYIKRAVDNGYVLRYADNPENKVTQTQTSANSEPRTLTGGFEYYINLSNADALFVPSVGNYEDTTKFQTPVSQNLLESAKFPGSAYKSSTITTQATNGKVTLNPEGTATYTPNNGFSGTDTVKFTVTDQNGKVSNEGTWTINVTPPAPPTGQGESDTIQAGETATRDLKANDSFPESPYKSTTITANPANGKVVRNADGTYTYTPNAGWVGTDTVVYTQTDAFGNTTEELTWTINVAAPAAPNAQPDTLELAFDANGSVDLTKNDTANGLNNSINKGTATFTDGSKSQTIDGVTFTINDQGVLTVDSKDSKNAGTYELAYNVRDAYGTPGQAGILVKIAEPTAQVGVKVLIAGEDANDSANPVVLAPGEKVVTYEITNPNTYALDASNFKLLATDGSEIALKDGFSIAPGATGTVEGTVDLPKQGTASVEATAKVAYNYTLNGTAKTVSASAEDPAYVKAETGTITLAEDSARVRVGESVTIDPLANDEASSGLDRSTLTYQFDPAIWTEGEDGTYTSEFGTVSVDEDSNLVYKGTAEGKLEGVTYTVKSNLGDEHAPANISVEVFDYHIELKALVGKDKLDANDKDSAYEEIITDEDVEEVEVPVTLDYTNPSETDSVTVTHFTDNLGNTYTLEEPKVLAPGEFLSFEGTQVFGVGEHEVIYTIHTTEGVTATDPIHVVIAKEIVPNDPPTHSVPEMSIPTPEPTPEPTPVMEKPKPKPFTPDTGSGLLVNGKKVEAPSSNAGLVAGTLVLLAGMGTALGLVRRRNSKA